MNQKQVAFHLYCMAIRANPTNALSKLRVLQNVCECLEISEQLAFETFIHCKENEYLREIAQHSEKFAQLSVPDPKIDDFFDIFSHDFEYNPVDNVKTKDEKCLDIPGWRDLNMEIFAHYAATKENGMSRFMKLMKSKSDISRRYLENCRTSLLDLSAKICKKCEKMSE